MAKTLPLRKILAVMTTTDAPPIALQQLEAAGQTYQDGELVLLVAGLMTEIGDNPALIYGVARKDATGVTSTPGNVWLLNNTTIFEANVVGAASADRVGVQADVGAVMALIRNTTLNKTFLNGAVQAGANTRVFVHGYAKDSEVGDTNPRMLFTFLEPYIQSLQTS